MDNENIPRRFDFSRDTFAFANELVWEYRVNATTGKMTFHARESKPDYTHHCFVLVRAARQFFYHARFDPSQKAVDAATYQRLVREVNSRNPRIRCPIADQIIIPGFASLREFSVPWEKLLKAHCGGAWRSYVMRSHWRMILPISRNHQERTAAQLVAEVEQNNSPIIHLVNFPSLTINHGAALFAAVDKKSCVEFSVYDPNYPEEPATLTYKRAERTFSFPSNSYWRGGNLKIIEIFRSWLI